MKRFEQWNQGYKASEDSNNNGDNKSLNQNKKSLCDTKKNLGFQWDVPN